MSVSPDLVPLGTAKAWAKRLAKSTKTLTPDAPWPLARCQLAVAHMLGFDHWHALNQALGPPASPAFPVPSSSSSAAARPTSSTGFQRRRPPPMPMPTSPAEWEKYWATLLDIEGNGGDVHLEFRGKFAQIRLRIHGKMVDYATIDSDMALDGFVSIIQPHMMAGFRHMVGKGPAVPGEPWGYVHEKLALISSSGTPTRFQFLPVYQKGFDIVFAAPSQTEHAEGLEHLNLPTLVQAELIRLMSFNAGAFFFASKEGQGRSGLMRRAVHDLAIKSQVRSKAIRVENDRYEGISARGPITTIVAVGPGKEVMDNALLAALRQDPDILVIGEVQENKVAKAVFKAARSGIAVFSSCNAQHAEVQERLRDFNVSPDELANLRGWAFTRLLPVLCSKCAIPSKAHPGTLQAPHPGNLQCAECDGLGYVDRQMVVSLVELIGGQEKKVCCHMDQALALVRAGRVSLEDAEDVLNPILGQQPGNKRT